MTDWLPYVVWGAALALIAWMDYRPSKRRYEKWKTENNDRVDLVSEAMIEAEEYKRQQLMIDREFAVASAEKAAADYVDWVDANPRPKVGWW